MSRQKRIAWPVIAGLAGSSLLEGATTLTLTLVDVDAQARTFTWSLQ